MKELVLLGFGQKNLTKVRSIYDTDCDDCRFGDADGPFFQGFSQKAPGDMSYEAWLSGVFAGTAQAFYVSEPYAYEINSAPSIMISTCIIRSEVNGFSWINRLSLVWGDKGADGSTYKVMHEHFSTVVGAFAPSQGYDVFGRLPAITNGTASNNLRGTAARTATPACKSIYTGKFYPNYLNYTAPANCPATAEETAADDFAGKGNCSQLTSKQAAVICHMKELVLLGFGQKNLTKVRSIYDTDCDDCRFGDADGPFFQGFSQKAPGDMSYEAWLSGVFAGTAQAFYVSEPYAYEINSAPSIMISTCIIRSEVNGFSWINRLSLVWGDKGADGSTYKVMHEHFSTVVGAFAPSQGYDVFGRLPTTATWTELATR